MYIAMADYTHAVASTPIVKLPDLIGIYTQAQFTHFLLDDEKNQVDVYILLELLGTQNAC